MSKNKYNVWKTDSKCNPIEGTDKIMRAPSKRWLMNHIAYENGVEILHGSLIVRLPNGDMWTATKRNN